MCGILVQLTTVNDKSRFSEALNLQAHRGPDDYGVLEVGNNLFGHRRLSIIDLDHSAAQPMMSLDGNVVIVFNGEIYNFKELKNSLKEKGYSFITNGDTEVLIYLYKEYGIRFLEKLIGMFAFVLHDKAINKTYVVRDRLGIKPLYIHRMNNAYIFSSEVKSILHLLDYKPDLNEIAVSSYFSFRYPILNDTFYKDINSLEPGSYLCVSDNGSEKIKYWDLAPMVLKQSEDKGEEFYLSEVKRLLKSSIEYRQIADVNVGAYLSGGVDSSAIAAFMAIDATEKVPTFTIGFDEDGYNEFSYADLVAKRYNTEHHEIVLSGEDYFSTMEKLIDYKDAPLSVPNEVPLYLMSKELKKLVTVVLSGEGADEIFGGYGRIFRSAFEYEKLKEINAKSSISSEEDEFITKIYKKYGRTSFEDEVDHFYSIYSYTNEELKATLLTDEIHNEKNTKLLKDKFRDVFSEVEHSSYATKMMYAFEKIHLVGLLQRVDLTTMAASVEARVPFVDHRLVEFAFTIPVKYKLKWCSTTEDENNLLISEEVSEIHDIPKYILKKTLENELDEEILYRKKMGFPVPLDKWFGGEFNLYAKELFKSSPAKLTSVINLKNINEILDDRGLVKNHSLAMKVWMLINIVKFMERSKYMKGDA